MSIVDLIYFVTACAIFFGGLRVAGIYGAVLGGFALQAAIGRLGRRNDWQLGALGGAVTCIGTLASTWLLYGTSNQVGQPPFTDERLGVVSYFGDVPGSGPFVVSLMMCFAISFVIVFFLPRDSGQTRTDVAAVLLLSIAAIAIATSIAIACIQSSA